MHRRKNRVGSILKAAVATIVLFSPSSAAITLIAAPAMAIGGGSDPTVVTGIVSRNGSPDLSATVLAQVWPNDATLNALPIDGTVTPYTIGPMEVDPTGRYDVNVDPLYLPAMYKTGNFIDVEINIISGGEMSHWTVTAQLPVAGSSTKHYSAASGYLQTPTFNFEMGSTPTVAETYTTSPPSTWVDSIGYPVGGSNSEPLVKTAGAVPTCSLYWVPKTVYNGLRERFMTVSSWSGAKGKVTVTSAGKNTLGVGWKAEGKGWKVNGSKSVSNSSSATGVMPDVINKHMYNLVNYRDYEYWQSCPFSTTRIGVERRPTGMNDLINSYMPAAGHVYNSYCVDKATGTYGKSQGKNVTYSTGVETPGGANFSAQAGFDSETKVEFTVTQHSFFCGDNSAGWANPASTRVDTRPYGTGGSCFKAGDPKALSLRVKPTQSIVIC